MKCPHCDKQISFITVTETEGRALGRTTLRCNGYTCPLCSKLISVQVDPLALKTDILRGVEALLQKR